MRRLFISLLVLSVFVSGTFSVSAQHILTAAENGFEIIHSDASRLSLRVNTPVYALTAAETVVHDPALDGYVIVEAPGLVSSSPPGEPQLPRLSKLIGVPPGVEIGIVVCPGRSIPLKGSHALAPAPQIELIAGESPQSVEVYKTDPRAYASQEWAPLALAQVSEEFWLRGQRVARLDITPFQYQPAQGRLLWYPEIEVSVNFRAVAGADEYVYGAESALGVYDPFDSALGSVLINYDQARDWQIDPGSAANGLVAAPNIPTTLTQPAYKIIVDQDGLYRVTGAELSAAGLNLTALNPTNLHLSNQGRAVAISLYQAVEGQFSLDDYILFYGEKYRGDYMSSFYQTENKHWLTYRSPLPDGTYNDSWKPRYNKTVLEYFTGENVYWLTVENEPGLRLETRDGDPALSLAETPASYRVIQREEESRTSYTYHFTSEDVWLWEQVTTAIRPYTTTLTAVVDTGQPAQVRGEVLGFNHNPNINPDQHTRLFWNNTTTYFFDATWDGPIRYRFEATLPVSQLLEGANILYYRSINDTGVSPRTFFDWYEVEYDRGFVALNNQLGFSLGQVGDWKYQVRGFTDPNILALDISNPLKPVMILDPEVISESGQVTATFAVQSTEASRYLVTASAAILSPKSIASYTPYLRTAILGADYIFISHANFITTTQVLADYRKSQGLRTEIINIDDIYNEFSFGIQQPLAIRDFLRSVFLSWQPPAPAYVALVGDGHLNPKGFAPDRLGTEPSFMLPNMGFVDISMGFMDATNLLGAVVGDDPLADVAISRIPVNSPAEMQVIVDKILAYENAPIQDWQRELLFIADVYDPNAGNFEQSAEVLINKYAHSGFNAQRLYVREIGASNSTECTGICTEIVDRLNTHGALLMVYGGHGAPKLWGKSTIFHVNFVPGLTNSEKLPILLSLDCWDGYWAGVGTATSPGMAETLLRYPDGGIIAAYSPVGLSVASGQNIQADAFFASMFEHGSWNLGSAAYAAKLKLYTLGGYPDQIQIYTIFGDPALRIKSPYQLQAAPSPASRSVEAGTQASYTVTITNTGAVTDTFSLSFSGNQWIASAGSPLTLPPGESGQTGVTVTVPITASIGSRDTANGVVVSQGDKAQSAKFRLTTTALSPYRLTLSPASSSQSLFPGQTAYYTLTLTNTANITDSFTLAADAFPWAASYPAVVGPIAPGKAASVVVSIQIPMHAAGEAHESLTIRAASVGDPAKTAQANLVTTALPYFRILMPVILKTGTSP